MILTNLAIFWFTLFLKYGLKLHFKIFKHFSKSIRSVYFSNFLYLVVRNIYIWKDNFTEFFYQSWYRKKYSLFKWLITNQTRWLLLNYLFWSNKSQPMTTIFKLTQWCFKVFFSFRLQLSLEHRTMILGYTIHQTNSNGFLLFKLQVSIFC